MLSVEKKHIKIQHFSDGPTVYVIDERSWDHPLHDPNELVRWDMYIFMEHVHLYGTCTSLCGWTDG